MKKLFSTFCLILILTSSAVSAQITFKSGYFLDNSDSRIDCLIKDVDWKSNPSNFEYKLSENSEVQTARIQDVKLFQITDYSKYVRKNVQIDRWDVLSPATNQKHPIYKSETLFLREVIAGPATLYAYVKDSFTTFFYEVNNSDTKQLIRKEYIVDTESGYKKRYINNMYKRQLLEDLKSDDISEKQANNLRYYESDFLKFFQKYNTSKGATSEYIAPEKVNFNLTAKFGLVQNSLKMQYSPDERYNYDFGSKTQVRVGAEIELVLPFNRSKWGVFIEPVYTAFKAEGDGTLFTDDVDYKAIEFQFGLRHYMFLNEKSKVFLHVGAIYAYSINGEKYDAKRYEQPFKYIVPVQALIGAGYQYNKLSAEVRYLGEQNIVGKQTDWNGKFTSLAFVLGYQIF